MRLRNVSLLVPLVLASLVGPLSSEARAEEASYTIGFVTPYSPETEVRWHTGLRAGPPGAWLRSRAQRHHLVPVAQGRDELLPDLVAELLRLKVDVLLTVGTPATRAAQRGNQHRSDRHGDCSRSGSRGVRGRPFAPRRQYHRVHGAVGGAGPEAPGAAQGSIPRASLIAVLWDPTHPTNALDLKRTEDAARALGLKVRGVAAHDRGEVDKAFVEMNRWHADALVVLTSYSAFVQLPRIVELANRSQAAHDVRYA